MKLTLHISGKDEDWNKTVVECDSDLEVSAEEYDFVFRMLRKSREFHTNPMRGYSILLSHHAPQMASKVSDKCDEALRPIGYNIHFQWQWGEQTITDSQYHEEDLVSDEECEVLLVTFCGVAITEKNIIGCHFRNDFIYETYPGDAGGITDRRGFDVIDCDIFGCDLDYWNHEAGIARSKHAYYELLKTTLSVEYLDEHGHYKILSKEYEGPYREWEPEAFAKAMQRSLRIIRKKILRHELERIC